MSTYADVWNEKHHHTQMIIGREARPRHVMLRYEMAEAEDLGPSWSGVGHWHEDVLIDQLTQLPTDDQVSVLVNNLSERNVRGLAFDVFAAGVASVKTNRRMELAKVLVGWTATAEELIASRGRTKHLIAARERMRKNRQVHGREHA